jgi:sRNA-binding carbon storage regulator CsrA
MPLSLVLSENDAVALFDAESGKSIGAVQMVRVDGPHRVQLMFAAPNEITILREALMSDTQRKAIDKMLERGQSQRSRRPLRPGRGTKWYKL